MQADYHLYLSELISPSPPTDYYLITLAPHPPLAFYCPIWAAVPLYLCAPRMSLHV